MILPRLPTEKELEFIEALEPVLRRIEAGDVTVDEIMQGLHAAASDMPPALLNKTPH